MKCPITKQECAECECELFDGIEECCIFWTILEKISEIENKLGE